MWKSFVWGLHFFFSYFWVFCHFICISTGLLIWASVYYRHTHIQLMATLALCPCTLTAWLHQDFTKTVRMQRSLKIVHPNCYSNETKTQETNVWGSKMLMATPKTYIKLFKSAFLLSFLPKDLTLNSWSPCWLTNVRHLFYVTWKSKYSNIRLILRVLNVLSQTEQIFNVYFFFSRGMLINICPPFTNHQIIITFVSESYKQLIESCVFTQLLLKYFFTPSLASHLRTPTEV